MVKIAITGNIASGKTVVEDFLRQKGYEVYDTDKIAHEILANSVEVREVFSEFDILENGMVSRVKLGKIVFNDAKSRKILENIIHPKVKQIIENLSGDLVFVAVPLLFEAKWESLFDKIVFVSAPLETRLKRLMVRNNLNEQEAMMRINAQEAEEEKIKNSDFIINNDKDIENLYKQLEELISSLQV